MKHRLVAAGLLLLSVGVEAGDRYRLAWSHYTGWEPWGYAADKGIVARWADKYGIEIEVTLVNDYIESLNLYTAGSFDAVVATNMDALTIPAVGGVDTTALVLGDFSNGNDGIVAKGATAVTDLRGRQVMLVELSVSHYLLARALDMHGMSERDLTLMNVGDAEIAGVFLAQEDAAAVTWNPPLQQIRNAKGATLLFDSSQIPGEIMDLLIVRSDAPDSLKKALAGAWYEVMATMAEGGQARDAAIADMADQAGATIAEFEAQLKTTALFTDAAKAAALVSSEEAKQTMEHVRSFAFDKGLYGNGAPSKDLVGIAFPDGSVLGDPENVRLRFDAGYMTLAAEGKL